MVDPDRGAFLKGEDPTGDGTAVNVRALYQVCPHLGCRPNPCIEDFWFHCPCHQSRYDRLGTKAAGVRFGPAPRSMDRYAVAVDANGVLTIDRTRLTLGPLPVPLGQPGIDPAEDRERLCLTTGTSGCGSHVRSTGHVSAEPPQSGRPGSRLIRLYPRAWRDRYEDEFLAVLEGVPSSRSVSIDVARGALDAHLHPAEPSSVPGLAAVVGGGLWLLGAAQIAALPVVPDWPGYFIDSLPLAFVAVLALTVAVVGAWFREDGRGRRAGRRLGRVGVILAVAGHLAWATALAATLAGFGYGAPVAVASTAAGLGTILVGLALAAAGDWPIAGLLVIAPILLVLPPWLVPSPAAWMAFGAIWIGVGTLELFGRPRTAGPLGWSG